MFSLFSLKNYLFIYIFFCFTFFGLIFFSSENSYENDSEWIQFKEYIQKVPVYYQIFYFLKEEQDNPLLKVHFDFLRQNLTAFFSQEKIKWKELWNTKARLRYHLEKKYPSLYHYFDSIFLKKNDLLKEKKESFESLYQFLFQTHIQLGMIFKQSLEKQQSLFEKDFVFICLTYFFIISFLLFLFSLLKIKRYYCFFISELLRILESSYLGKYASSRKKSFFKIDKKKNLLFAFEKLMNSYRKSDEKSLLKKQIQIRNFKKNNNLLKKLIKKQKKRLLEKEKEFEIRNDFLKDIFEEINKLENLILKELLLFKKEEAIENILSFENKIKSFLPYFSKIYNFQNAIKKIQNEMSFIQKDLKKDLQRWDSYEKYFLNLETKYHKIQEYIENLEFLIINLFIQIKNKKQEKDLEKIARIAQKQTKKLKKELFDIFKKSQILKTKFLFLKRKEIPKELDKIKKNLQNYQLSVVYKLDQTKNYFFSLKKETDNNMIFLADDVLKKIRSYQEKLFLISEKIYLTYNKSNKSEN